MIVKPFRCFRSKAKNFVITPKWRLAKPHDCGGRAGKGSFLESVS